MATTHTQQEVNAPMPAQDGSTPKVRGQCPMGCGETLILGDGGYVTCSFLHCPEPDAVSTILDDRETEHTVRFDDDGFTVRHPLRERLRDQLLECDLHTYCASLPGPPVKPGAYHAVRDQSDGTWQFTHA